MVHSRQTDGKAKTKALSTLIGTRLSLQASLESCRRICAAITSRIALIEQEEQNLKDTLSSNTLSKLVLLEVELQEAIFSFIPYHPSADYQRHYLYSLRPPRFLSLPLRVRLGRNVIGTDTRADERRTTTYR